MDIFKPKVPVPETQAKPATIDEAARSQDIADQKRRRRGRASTIMVPDAAPPAAATILGG